MGLFNTANDDQDEAAYIEHYRRYAIQYQALVKLGMPTDLAIGLTLDWHRIQWEQYYKEKKEKEGT